MNVMACLIVPEDKNTPEGFVFTEPSGVMVLLGITRARFRKAGFWLYQVHFSGFSAHKFRCFHCVFLSAQWIAVKLMSQGFVAYQVVHSGVGYIIIIHLFSRSVNGHRKRGQLYAVPSLTRRLSFGLSQASQSRSDFAPSAQDSVPEPVSQSGCSPALRR